MVESSDISDCCDTGLSLLNVLPDREGTDALLSVFPLEPKPVVDMHILIVALLIRTKASLQASAGGHFSMRSFRTEVAASIVKSTSSSVKWLRTTGECQTA